MYIIPKEAVKTEKNTPSASRSEMTQFLPHYAINGANRLLGGYMLTWIDEVAAAAAKRFCRSMVTTAGIDTVEFIAPAYLGELFTVTGVVTRAGKTSVEVKVEGHTEHDDGTKTLICRAYAIFVAIDENGKPKNVPQLECENDEQRAELERAIKRDELRKQRRALGI